MRTEGQRHLGRVAAKNSQWDIAHACGVSQAIVSFWISGRYRPSYENRKILAKRYGIALDAWELTIELRSAR